MRRTFSIFIIMSTFLATAAYTEDESGEDHSRKFITKVEGGFNLWCDALLDTDMEDVDRMPGGVMGAVQALYTIIPNIAVGVEVAYLPMYYGTYLEWGPTEYQFTLSFLPVTLEAVFDNADLFAALGVGYAPFIGNTRRITGETIDVTGFFFAKIEVGFNLIRLGDRFMLHGGLAAYLGFTPALSSPSDFIYLNELYLNLCPKLGVTGHW
jgi:hypothetical protein